MMLITCLILTDQYFIIGQLRALYHGTEETRVAENTTDLEKGWERGEAEERVSVIA